jgi:hypothetical protein
LITTGQPEASAGPALRVIIAFGKFHGVISAGDADRLLDDDDALVGHGEGNGVAVDPLRLLGEPFDERGAVGDLAARLGERLALLGGEDLREILLVRHHQLEPLAQDRGALLACLRAPRRPGAVRGVDGAPRLVGALASAPCRARPEWRGCAPGWYSPH